MIAVDVDVFLCDEPSPDVCCKTYTVPHTGTEFIALKVGPITFYPTQDQLYQIRNTIGAFLVQESSRCPVVKPSPLSSEIVPICDGTSFPLLPTSGAEATSEPVVTA